MLWETYPEIRSMKATTLYGKTSKRLQVICTEKFGCPDHGICSNWGSDLR